MKLEQRIEEFNSRGNVSRLEALRFRKRVKRTGLAFLIIGIIAIVAAVIGFVMIMITGLSEKSYIMFYYTILPVAILFWGCGLIFFGLAYRELSMSIKVPGEKK